MLVNVLDSLFPQPEDAAPVNSARLARRKIRNIHSLENALSSQKHTSSMKLGEILVCENLISYQQINDALEEQKKDRKKALGEILVARGLITSYQIQQCLAMKLGIPFIGLRDIEIKPEVIQLLDAAMVFRHNVLPVHIYNSKLVVAIENPLDWQLIDALNFNTNRFHHDFFAS